MLEERALSETLPIIDWDLRIRPGSSRPDVADPQEWARAVEYGRVPYRSTGPNGDVLLYAYVAIPESEVIAFLCADAAATLPPGTRYEIRMKPTRWTEDDYSSLGYPPIGSKSAREAVGRSFMAWYRHVDMDNDPEWGSAPLGLQDTGGWGRTRQCVTPIGR